MMVAAATLSFRECFEVGMVLSIVCAATRGIPRRMAWYSLGVMLGIGGAAITAILLQTLASEWMDQHYTTTLGGILSLASVMIGWTVVWMRQQGRAMGVRWRMQGEALRLGQTSMMMVAGLIAVTVWREASELMLLLWATASVSPEAAGTWIGGFSLGCLGAIGVSIAVYWGIISLPVHIIFSVTSWLMVALSASLLGQGVMHLAAEGWLPELGPQVWDSSAWISMDSWLGLVLRGLVGYTPAPSGIQVLAMGCVWLILGRILWKSRA